MKSLLKPLLLCILYMFVTTSTALADETVTKWNSMYYHPAQEWTVQGKVFTGSVNSRVYLYGAQESEALVAMLDTTGIQHGLRANTMSKIVHAYLEGFITSWGGEIVRETGLPANVCPKGFGIELETKFGNQPFIYAVCTLNSLNFSRILITLTWNKDGSPIKPERAQATFARGGILELEGVDAWEKKLRKPI